MPIPNITQWIEERRACAFALARTHELLGDRVQSKMYAAEAADYSRRASELRAIKNRASASPPDLQARERLSRIQAAGFSSWSD
jgi:hypothetical protein